LISFSVMSVLVDDQDKAQAFYTEKLGFETKIDIPVDGEARWLTVASKADPDGMQLLLEPDGNPAIQINGEPAAQVFKRTLYEAGIPWTAFATDDLNAEYQRLKGLGVHFTMEPTAMPGVSVAVFDDTCGNLIQLQQLTGE
jgi:catechol 2,3-dioxygenase-like lactoylglutathione lyase family enzyme